jgi:hypothetical protein
MNISTVIGLFIGALLAVAIDAAGLNPFCMVEAFGRWLAKRLTR